MNSFSWIRRVAPASAADVVAAGVPAAVAVSLSAPKISTAVTIAANMTSDAITKTLSPARPGKSAR